MVPMLSSTEKPKTGWTTGLALLGSQPKSPVGNRATDITLDSQDPVLPGAAKMTLIVPNEGFTESFLSGSEFV